MKKLIFFVLCSFVFCNSNYYQNLFDLSNTGYTKYNTVNKLKSIVYSGLIPGAGQYFVNNQKTKGIIFLGIELISWAAYSHYISEAEKYQNQYQQFSINHWSFASWCDHYYDFDDPNNPDKYQYRDLFSNEETGIYSEINTGHGLSFYYDDEDGIRRYMQTNTESFFLFYNEYNLDSDGVAEIFVEDNNLIMVTNHDFYEEIVKYDQFFTGWDDQDQIQRITNDWGQDNATSPNKTYAKRLYDKSVENYKIQDWVISAIYVNHAVSMLDALLVSSISSQNLSLSYDYNPIINFHEAQLILKLD